MQSLLFKTKSVFGNEESLSNFSFAHHLNLLRYQVKNLFDHEVINMIFIFTYLIRNLVEKSSNLTFGVQDPKVIGWPEVSIPLNLQVLPRLFLIGTLEFRAYHGCFILISKLF